MSVLDVLCVFSLVLFVNALQIKYTYNLTSDVQTMGSNFEVVDQSVIFINPDKQLVKMGIANQKNEALLPLTAAGFSLFNSSVGALIIENPKNGQPVLYTFDPSGLSLGEPKLVGWNHTTLYDLTTVPNSPASIIYGFALEDGQGPEPVFVVQIDAVTGDVLNFVTPCVLPNGTAIPMQSYQAIQNPVNSQAPGFLAILCVADESDNSELVLLDVKTWSLSKNFDTKAEAEYLHAITSDILGYIAYVNESGSQAHYDLVAFSVRQGSIVARLTITPMDSNDGNSTAVTSAIGDGNGSTYITTIKFDAENNAYGSSVIQVTYGGSQGLTVSGSVSTTNFWFSAGFPNSFIVNSTLYLWAFFYDHHQANENFVVIGN